MSTPEEQKEAIKHAVEAARRSLAKLKEKKFITRAEEFEIDMHVDCIKRGEKILGVTK